MSGEPRYRVTGPFVDWLGRYWLTTDSVEGRDLPHRYRFAWAVVRARRKADRMNRNEAA